MRITTLDFAILGLLLSGDKTAYAIRMIFKTTAMGNYSSSPGSIYPSTNKLKKLALIEQVSEKSGQLAITEAGKHQVKSWLNEPITEDMIAKSSEILILKFAFMDHLVSRQDKLVFLRSFLEGSKSYLTNLELYHQSASEEELPLHGRLSFEFGMATLKTQINWIKATLKTIEATS